MKALRRLILGILTLSVTTSVCVLAADDNVVAIINGHSITRAYIERQLRQMPLGDQIAVRSNLEKFTESLIQEEVLFQSVVGTNFVGEEQLRDEVKTLVTNYLIEKYVTQRIEVTEQDVLDFYNENASAVRGEVVDVSQILMSMRSECDALLKRARDGESFADLAREFSKHEESARQGGALGYFMDHNGPLGFEQRVFQMQPGELKVFDSDEGCHLIKVNKRIIPPVPPLENVAGQIEFLLRRQQEIDYLRALVEKSTGAVDVIIPAAGN